MNSYHEKVKESIKKASQIYKAYQHDARQEILKLIEEKGAITVTKIYKTLETNQSEVSRQLKFLRRANLVNTERKGKFVFYSINHPMFDKLIEASQILEEVLTD